MKRNTKHRMEIKRRCWKDEKEHKIWKGNHDEMRRMLRRDTKYRMEMLTRCGNGEKEHRIRDGNNEDMWEEGEKIQNRNDDEMEE